MSENFFKFVGGCCMVAVTYILMLALFVNSPPALNIPAYALAFTVAILVVAIAFISYGLAMKVKINTVSYMTVLVILTVVPRLLWTLFTKTVPDSDFLLYYDYAEKVSQGDFTGYHFTYPIFPFKVGYPLILSIFFKLFGASVLCGQLVNVLLSIGLAVLIYYLGRNIFGETIGRYAAIIFAMWPAQIMYTSVLASEHVFIVFFMLCILLFAKAAKETETNNIPRLYRLLLFTGIGLTLTQFIRPISLLLIPIFVFCLCFFCKTKAQSMKDKFITRSKWVIVLLAGYIVSLAALNLVVSNLTGINIWRSSMGYNMLVGTNYKHNGMYNTEDAKIVYEFDLDFDKIHKEAQKRAIQRITGDPLQFARLVENKMIKLWTDENYGYYWSTYKLERETALSAFFKANHKKIIMISQMYYLVLLTFVIFGLFYLIKNKVISTIPLLLFIAGFICSFALLEVQSRYHFPAIPLFMIIAGYGLKGVSEYVITAYKARYRPASGFTGYTINK